MSSEQSSSGGRRRDRRQRDRGHRRTIGEQTHDEHDDHSVGEVDEEPSPQDGLLHPTDRTPSDPRLTPNRPENYAAPSESTSSARPAYSHQGSSRLGSRQSIRPPNLLKQAASHLAHSLHPRSWGQGRRGSKAQEAPIVAPAVPAFGGGPFLNPKANESTSSVMSWTSESLGQPKAQEKPSTSQAVGSSGVAEPNAVAESNGVYQNLKAADSKASLASVRSGLTPAGSRPWQHHEFICGKLIWAPYHATALDANIVAEESSFCVQSAVAKISSKRRLMVVLWAYPTTLFCLPCSTHSGNGFSTGYAGATTHNIYLWDRENGAPEPPQTSRFRPLEVCRKDGGTDKPVSVSIADACSVSMREEIQPAGYLTSSETKRLIRIWEDAASDARAETRRNERE